MQVHVLKVIEQQKMLLKLLTLLPFILYYIKQYTLNTNQVVRPLRESNKRYLKVLHQTEMLLSFY